MSAATPNTLLHVLYLVSNGVSYQMNIQVLTQYILNLAAQQDTD
jgi:hypothetical protein